ncbi:hypothetical protein BJY04DRAFT_189463 [Aspergillus karnatakaensis]|uniref:putative translation regulator (Cya5) n=1 Tax=Aspergillus karnatakaensis TaxID=1810916 RepID=UPI003CCE0A6E
MLERTAGCFESAGRRFLRDANGSIRNRASLCNKLGQDGGSVSGNVRWPAAIRRTARQQNLRTASSSRSSSRPANDSRPPLLEFLYPDRTQEYVAFRLSRSTRSFFSRRKRKTFAGSRSFTSQTGFDQENGVRETENSPETESNWAKDSLFEVLDEGIYKQSERAWQLYMLAGRPPDLNPALLAQFSKVRSASGHSRAKQLFDSIPETNRTADDYWHLANSYIGIGQKGYLGRICKEAAANGHGVEVGSLALARSLHRAEWSLVQDIWENLRGVDGIALWEALLPRLYVASLQPSLLSLALLLERKKAAAEPAPSFARYLMDKVLRTPKFIEEFRPDSLLLLLERLGSAAVLTRDQFFGVIEMLQVSQKRSTFAQSVRIYSKFRSLVDAMVPPAELLERFLEQLALFRMSDSVEYFLQEFTRFRMIPSSNGYRHALSTLSHACQPSIIEGVFNEYVHYHGMPTSCAFLTPLLYVHARVGNVKDTLAQFERISTEFYLEPSHVCWNIVLTAYANSGNLTECFAHFRLMLSEGVKVNSHTFGIVMGLCAKRGDTQTVYKLLDMAKQHHVRITAPILDPIVEAHCNNQDYKEAEAFAESCLSLDVQGSRVRMWNIMLRSYAYRLDVDSISRLRTRMEEAGILPDDMTYAALMLSLVLLGQTDAARRILRTLHRGRHTQVTQFHYSIILYGYFRDRNRPMVQIILEEMEQRFKDVGSSSQLLFLRDQLQLDLRIDSEQNRTAPDPIRTLADPPVDPSNRAEPYPDLRFAHAEKTLAKLISEFDTTKRRAKQVEPGAGKLPPTQAFPAMYYESIAREYAKKGSYRRVEQLIEEYGKTQGLSYEEALDVAPLRIHAALMQAYSVSNQHDLLLASWGRAFRRAQELGARPGELDFLPLNAFEAPRPVMPTWEEEEYNNLLVNSGPTETQAFLLPAYRFVLSRHFSLYMQSLAYSKKKNRIDDAITTYTNAGFSMTTYNWSTYIHLFSLSDDQDEQLRAFTLFEKEFMPSFPGWKYLKRGKAVAHSGVPSAIRMLERPERRPPPNMMGPVGRKYWSQHHPDVLQPTYISMVFLAAALLRIRRDSILAGHDHLIALQQAAPQTLKALAKMPWLREKWQGILLRGNEKLPPNPPSLPKKKRFVWSGGLLGVDGRIRKLKPSEAYGYVSDKPPKSSEASETLSPANETLSIVLPSISEIESFESPDDWLENPLGLSFIQSTSPETRGAQVGEDLPDIESTEDPLHEKKESPTVSSSVSDAENLDFVDSEESGWRAIGPDDEFDFLTESKLSKRRSEQSRMEEFMDDPAKAPNLMQHKPKKEKGKRDPEAVYEVPNLEQYDEVPLDREVRGQIFEPVSLEQQPYESGSPNGDEQIVDSDE